MQSFPFRFSRAYSLAGLPFAVTPATTGVVVSDDLLQIRFGPWRLSTPSSNVVHTEVGGPYTFLKTAGPAHLSFSDHGVTFATNGDAGLCIQFKVPVRAINPLGPPASPNATVTVADPALLQQALHRDG